MRAVCFHKEQTPDYGHKKAMVFPLSLLIRPFIQQRREMLNLSLAFGLQARGYIKGRDKNKRPVTYIVIIGRFDVWHCILRCVYFRARTQSCKLICSYLTFPSLFWFVSSSLCVSNFSTQSCCLILGVNPRLNRAAVNYWNLTSWLSLVVNPRVLIQITAGLMWMNWIWVLERV